MNSSIDKSLLDMAAPERPLNASDPVYSIVEGKDAKATVADINRVGWQHLPLWTPTADTLSFTNDAPYNLSASKPSEHEYAYQFNNVNAALPIGITLWNERLLFGGDHVVKMHADVLNNAGYGAGLMFLPGSSTTAQAVTLLSGGLPENIIYIFNASNTFNAFVNVAGQRQSISFVLSSPVTSANPLYIRYSGILINSIIRVYQGNTLLFTSKPVDLSEWGSPKVAVVTQTAPNDANDVTWTVDTAATGFFDSAAMPMNAGITFPANKQKQAYRVAADIAAAELKKDNIVIFAESGNEFLRVENDGLKTPYSLINQSAIPGERLSDVLNIVGRLMMRSHPEINSTRNFRAFSPGSSQGTILHDAGIYPVNTSNNSLSLIWDDTPIIDDGLFIFTDQNSSFATNPLTISAGGSVTLKGASTFNVNDSVVVVVKLGTTIYSRLL